MAKPLEVRDMENRLVVGLSVVFSLIACAVAGAQAAEPANRPAHWAQPVPMAGVPNLHRVSDVLLRSAQPTAQGLRNLQQLGVKTVINLRAHHSDEDELADTRILPVRIPIHTWHLKKEHILRFLAVVMDPDRQPVLVHCQHGADRTGTMVAFYRMLVQGWSRREALAEMQGGGFGFHTVWNNLIAFIEAADLEEYRENLKTKTREANRDR
jgi:protein tyrosine/serine phosphatase